MQREIVKYGHPALRKPGAEVAEIDDAVRGLVDDMLDTMDAAAGIGLAAPQIAESVQLCVVDVTPIEDRPSRLWINEVEVPISDHMPMILINPKIEVSGDSIPGPEGCLSFPEIYGDVLRPPRAKVRAHGINGETLDFECDGLLSRCIQHEHDHLQGILFIDRMTQAERDRIRDEITELQNSERGRLA